MKFLMMMHAPYGSGEWDMPGWSPDDVKRMVGFMLGFNEQLKREGVFVAAEGLAPPNQARVVRAAPNGKPLVTDGPFAETKEFLAGYWIVDVASKDAAWALAARASACPGPGGQPLNMPIEVREVMPGPPVEP
jgi:hypothetical protein